MYHVSGTLITISILYLTSYFFYRSGIYSQTLHRKFWNIILALTFLFTSLAGIFMALQINYKWNIPFISKLLSWHVEAGVALGLTGIFHFLWHISYYTNIFKRSEKPVVKSSFQKTEPFNVFANLFMVGFTSTSVQILLIRELMNITGGYELISGVFLGSWLIASAAGAAVAGRSELSDIRKINLLFASGPFISIILLLLLSKLFLQTGEVPSFLIAMILTLILLLPICLISGFTFIKLTRHAKEHNNIIAGRSFSIETTGGIIAGVLITLLTSGLVSTWKLLLLIILLFLAYVLLTFYIKRKGLSLLTRITFFIIIIAVVVTEPDILFRQLMLPALKVTSTKDTPYGNLTIGEYSGEESTYYNHQLLNYQDDVMEREENIHYAMLQANDPHSVLLVSGKPESHLSEIMKYTISKVVFVERDPLLAKKAEAVLDGSSSEVIIENRDAFRYIRTTGEIFDVIIMLLPPPSTLSLNRFYTTEFFRQVRERLSEEGIFMCSPGPNDYYLNQESINLYSSIYNSLGVSFRNVIPVAGNKLYFIASDNDVSASFCKLAEEKGIDNVYVNCAFLSDDLTESKSAEIKSLMDTGIRENRLTYPVACFHFQTYNFSKSVNERIPAIILMVAAFLIPLPVVRRKNMLMYFSAASLAGFEIIILLGLQLTVGNIYQITGLVIAVLMAGLAAGAGSGMKWLDKTDMRLQALALALYYIALALCLNAITEMEGTYLTGTLLLLSVLPPAFLTGNIFRKLTLKTSNGFSVSGTYSADLAGSALGFILLSGIAIPAIGIRNSVILLSVFVLTGIIFGRPDK